LKAKISTSTSSSTDLGTKLTECQALRDTLDGFDSTSTQTDASAAIIASCGDIEGYQSTVASHLATMGTASAID
jgi:hypothetical protein